MPYVYIEGLEVPVWVGRRQIRGDDAALHRRRQQLHKPELAHAGAERLVVVLVPRKPRQGLGEARGYRQRDGRTDGRTDG